MATPGRVQAPELNLRPSLNPAPVVQVEMVRPVNREGAGSNLMQIAESLAGLGNAVTRFGMSTRPKEGEKPKDYFPDIAQSFTPDQIVNDPRFNAQEDGHRVLFGTNYAHQMGRTFQEMVRTEWDPEQEPLDVFLNRKVQETMSTFEDPTGATQAGFGKTIDTYVKETRTWWDKLQTENADAQRQQEMWKSVFNAADFDKDKRTVEERLEAAKAHLDELRSLKMLDGKTANQLLFNTIQQYAELGDKDMVRALSGMRRGTNNEIDPLADTPEWSDRIDELIAKADANWVDQDATRKNTFLDQVDKLVETGSENELTAFINSEIGQRLYPDPSSRADFLRSNVLKQKEVRLKNTVEAEKQAGEIAFKNEVLSNFWRMNGGQNYTDRVVTTKDGKNHTIPASRAQEFIDEDIRARYEKAVQEGPEAVAMLDQSLARIAGSSSLKLTEWENVFSGVLDSTADSALLEGKVPPKMDRAFELWKNTKGHEYVRRRNMGENADRTDDFFAAADMLIAGGSTKEAAFQTAYLAMRPERRNRAIQRVEEVAWGSGSSKLRLRDTLPTHLAGRVLDRATIYAAASGMNAEKAVDKAMRDFKEEYIQLDVGPTSFISVPRRMTEDERDAYKETVESFVQNQIETLGPKAMPPLDPETLTISEVMPGKFMLYQDGEPIDAKVNGKEGVLWFSFDDIQKHLLAEEEKANKEAATEAIEDNKNMQKFRQPIDPKGRSAFGAGVGKVMDFIMGEDGKPDDNKTHRDRRIEAGMRRWGVSREEAEKRLIKNGTISPN